MNIKTVILITGPTASGKTAMALSMAAQHQTEILSADSRQCYRELNIGVAKPAPEELQSIPHHFINTHSIHDPVNAAYFARYAHECAENIFRSHDTMIMVGGTGLYIRAFTDGLDHIPDVPPDIREEIQISYERLGMEWLQEEIRKADPLFVAQGEIHNPQRTMRALEVMRATGKSIIAFRKNNAAGNSGSFPYKLVKYAIDLPRAVLYDRIDQRVDEMMQDGLLQEAESLYPHRKLNALQTVGYAELFSYIDGAYSLDMAVEKIKQHTRQYAKRQLTWFRRDPELNWISR